MAEAETRPGLSGRLRLLAEWYFELAHRTIISGAILYACSQLPTPGARVLEVVTVVFLVIWTWGYMREAAGRLLPDWSPIIRRETLSWKTLVAIILLLATVYFQYTLITLVMSVARVLARHGE